MIEGVFQVAEMRVRDIMVPRAQMDVIDRADPPERYLPRVIETGHSRFPVIDGDKDKVVGILLAKDLLRYFHGEQHSAFNVYDLLRPAVFVPESKRLDVLLRDFRSSRNHMAIVVDEYGGVAGLVTIEDVLEQIVGEIEDRARRERRDPSGDACEPPSQPLDFLRQSERLSEDGPCANRHAAPRTASLRPRGARRVWVRVRAWS